MRIKVSRLALIVACLTVSITANDFLEEDGITVVELRLGDISGYDGRTGAGNFTRFLLYRNNPIRVVLMTISGDADIYVSYSKANMTYNLGDFDQKAASCGLDYLDIPADDGEKPIFIGIYGHPYHEFSSWRVLIIAGENDSYSVGNFPLEPEQIYETERFIEEHDVADSDESQHWADRIQFFIEILLEFVEIVLAVLV